MNLKSFVAVAGALALAACDGNSSDPAALRGKSYYVIENGTPVTIAFDANEMRVNGRVVNLYNGTYEVTGNKIKFGPLATTMMMGPENAMAAEREYLQFLDTVQSYDLNGERLVLKGADDREIVFQQVELTEDAQPVTDAVAGANGNVQTLPMPAGERPIMRVDEIPNR